jgi:hypothetical protein
MKFYLLSPYSVPPNPHLFPQFIEEWQRQGVEIVDRIEDCDCVMFDFHSRLADYKQSDLQYVIDKKLPLATFCEWDRGNLSSDIWPDPLTDQQKDLFHWLQFTGQPQVHFCRLLDKTKTYPNNLYPYEKPILYEEHLLSPDELFNREYDIGFIANHAPSRLRIAEALGAGNRLKVRACIGEIKIPLERFLNDHKRCKLFVSSGAGGFTDERKQYLFSIAGIIQERTDQLLLHELPLTGCIYIDSPPTIENLDRIYNIINDKECLYKIYENGYNFMKTYYSKEYIANDILNKIKKHLW